MCDIASVAILATGLSVAAQAKAQKQVKEAQRRAQQAELERQRVMREQASQLFNQSLASEGKEATIKAEDEAIAKRQADVAEVQESAPSTDIGSSYGNESKIVADESRVRTSAGKAAANLDANAKAKLAAFGDAAQLKAIKNARASTDLGIVARNQAGSAAAFEAEMAQAGQAGDRMRNIGSALSTIGGLTGMAAGAGWGNKTAEQVANSSLDNAGFINSLDGADSLRPVGDGNYLHMQTNKIIPGSEINWNHFGSAQTNTTPAVYKPFMAVSDWFSTKKDEIK
jgi:hypothetical protein